MEDFFGEGVVFGRVDVEDAAAKDGEGAASGGEGTAVGGSVDSAGEPADYGDAGTCEACCESFGLAESVVGSVAGADDGDGEAVCGAEGAADEEEAGWVVDFGEGGRVGIVVVGDDLDVVFAAEVELGVDVDVSFGEGDRPGEFGADARDFAELVHGSSEDAFGRVESGQERLADSGADAWDHGEEEVGPELGGHMRVQGSGGSEARIGI